MAIINPKAYLIGGLADILRSRGIAVVGPGAAGARLEASKDWMKQVTLAANIPTGRYQVFSDLDEAVSCLKTLSSGGPYVVKTDNPCGGEGVTVTLDVAEAIQDATDKLTGKAFGPAGQRILIEEGFVGREYSLIALCDGVRATVLPLARDYKRRGIGDTGPNTAGMGSFAPTPCPVSAEVLADLFITPLLTQLRQRGIEYRGWLFAGLIWTHSGPKLLEYNVRLGGPETQSQMPLVEPQSLLHCLEEVATGQLTGSLVTRPGHAVAIVLADSGYPRRVLAENMEIFGVAAAKRTGALFLPDDIKLSGSNWRAGKSGRVGCVVGTGATLAVAYAKAMAAMKLVRCRNTDYRTDIAAAYLYLD